MADNIDLLVKGWYVVTMNETRDIIRDGAVAIRGDRVIDVGKASRLEAEYVAAETIGGDRFVVTPGMVNTHIHVTGEPLTRGYVPDDTPFEENVFMWLCPLYSVYTAEEERLSAQLAAVEMLKSGTTTFLEAGTIRFLDEVVDGLVEVGIRGRVGKWVWDLPPEPDVYKQDTDQSIAFLQRQLEAFPATADDRTMIVRFDARTKPATTASSRNRTSGSQNPSVSNKVTGLRRASAWRPSWVQVVASNTSSSVP